ncbi:MULTISPECIES: pentapeptide repeat-containing protein [unclassified Gordonia (in: high G+C Gram-positive bacteria)]
MVLEDSSLVGTVLVGAVLVGAVLVGAVLVGAVLVWGVEPSDPSVSDTATGMSCPRNRCEMTVVIPSPRMLTP